MAKIGDFERISPMSCETWVNSYPNRFIGGEEQKTVKSGVHMSSYQNYMSFMPLKPGRYLVLFAPWLFVVYGMSTTHQQPAEGQR
jgi:hypothetical protein